MKNKDTKVNKFFRLINRLNDTKKRVDDFSSARKHLLTDISLSANQKSLLKIVPLQIHPNDGMYQGNARHYLSVGLSAVRCIELALENSNSPKHLQSILDFPCGYGRVLRFLRVRFPDAEISAAEIDPDMLAFCKRIFSVNPIKSDPDFNKLSLSKKFDLIWCGSLITHVDERTAINLLRFFHDHLSPEGVCIFTTHGQFSIDSIQRKTITYGLTVDAQNELLSQFHETGYGYADYENQQGYGISAVSMSVCLQLLEMSVSGQRYSLQHKVGIIIKMSMDLPCQLPTLKNPRRQFGIIL